MSKKKSAANKPRGQVAGSWILDLQIKNSGPKLTTAKLRDALAEVFGVTIDYPNEYINFMMKHNGGKPGKSHFVYSKGKKQIANWVTRIYSVVASDIDVEGLKGANRLLAANAIHIGVPYGCVSVGDTGTGDAILLFVTGDRRDQVWLKVWDEVCGGTSVSRNINPEEGLYMLSSSFAEFCSSLYLQK